MRSGIIAAGNWLIDHVKLIDAWPDQDALANIRGQSWGNGGSAYNILKDIALMGGKFPLEAVGLDDGADRRDRVGHRLPGCEERRADDQDIGSGVVHSALIPRFSTISAQRALSRLTMSASSAGVEVAGVRPCLPKASRASSELRIVPSSVL